MRTLVFKILSSVLGVWLAVEFIPGVELTGGLKTLFLIACVLGLLNFFVKPILKIITLPLRILTLGLFNFLISAALIWIIDVLCVELTIFSIPALFETALFVWLAEKALNLLFKKK